MRLDLFLFVRVSPYFDEKLDRICTNKDGTEESPTLKCSSFQELETFHITPYHTDNYRVNSLLTYSVVLYPVAFGKLSSRKVDFEAHGTIYALSYS